MAKKLPYWPNNLSNHSRTYCQEEPLWILQVNKKRSTNNCTFHSNRLGIVIQILPRRQSTYQKGLTTFQKRLQPLSQTIYQPKDARQHN